MFVVVLFYLVNPKPNPPRRPTMELSTLPISKPLDWNWNVRAQLVTRMPLVLVGIVILSWWHYWFLRITSEFLWDEGSHYLILKYCSSQKSSHLINRNLSFFDFFEYLVHFTWKVFWRTVPKTDCFLEIKQKWFPKNKAI